MSRAKEELTDNARERLDALVQTSDGFALAEVDLELRRHGELLGVRQSGASDLRFADLKQDKQLLERAKGIARSLDPAGPLADRVDALFAGAAATSLA